METSFQFFRNIHTRHRTVCALSDPSLMLVHNEGNIGFLISAGAHEDSFTGHLYLDDVSYFQRQDESCIEHDFACVAVYQEDGRWIAEDTATGHCFRPLLRQYDIVFISRAEYQRFQYFRSGGLLRALLELAWRYFDSPFDLQPPPIPENVRKTRQDLLFTEKEASVKPPSYAGPNADMRERIANASASHKAGVFRSLESYKGMRLSWSAIRRKISGLFVKQTGEK